MSRETRHRAFIDRIEDGVAVLLLGDEEKDRLLLPAGYLPPDAREGQALSLTIRIDEAETEAARDDTRALLDELLRRSGEEE